MNCGKPQSENDKLGELTKSATKEEQPAEAMEVEAEPAEWTLSKLTEVFLVAQTLKDKVKQYDPQAERSITVTRSITEGLQPLQQHYEELKRKRQQPPITSFFQKVASPTKKPRIENGTPLSKNDEPPRENGTSPSENGSSPSEDGTPPSKDGTPPSEDGTLPSEDNQAPSESDKPPCESDTSTSENNKPSCETGTPPSEDGTPPSEGIQAPSESDKLPCENGTSASEDGTSSESGKPVSSSPQDNLPSDLTSEGQ